MDAAGFQRGLDLFNRGEFFEAHEVLEDVWRAAPEQERKFLQGLIQVAVALHHHSQGNIVGARSVLARARKNLACYPGKFAGVYLAELCAALAECQTALDNGSSPPTVQVRSDRLTPDA